MSSKINAETNVRQLKGVLALLLFFLLLSCEKDIDEPTEPTYCWSCDKIETVTFGTNVTTKITTSKEMGWAVGCGLTEGEMQKLVDDNITTFIMYIDTIYNSTYIKRTEGIKVIKFKCSKQ